MFVVRIDLSARVSSSLYLRQPWNSFLGQLSGAAAAVIVIFTYESPTAR